METIKWCEAKTGNHQGLICDEKTGANIAVAYDKAHAPLIAAAPDLLAAAKLALKYLDNNGGGMNPKTALREAIEAAEVRP